MTKKDYELIAEVMREAYRYAEQPTAETICTVDEIVRIFAMQLGLRNPRFDAARFRAACEGKR